MRSPGRPTAMQGEKKPTYFAHFRVGQVGDGDATHAVLVHDTVLRYGSFNLCLERNRLSAEGVTRRQHGVV